MGRITVNLESFLLRAKEKHNNKFDYSLIKEMKNGEGRIDIICPKHGIFNQSTKQHLKGTGCRKCWGESCRTNVEDFKNRANLIHNNKYDYSEITEIIRNNIKLPIICPIHGRFYQSSNVHLRGSECYICGKDKQYKSRRDTYEEWLEYVKIKHNNKYDYSLVNYEKCDSKVKIICPEHGIFEQTAFLHTWGNGCQKCGIRKLGFCKDEYSKKFLEKAPIIHNNFYDYSKVEYITAHIDVIIVCPIHGEFKMKPYTHLDGSGCKECYRNRNGFSRTAFVKACKNNISTFYILECNNDNEIFLKIGITSRKMEERYSRPKEMPYNYKIILEIKSTPDNIWNLERRLLSEYRNSRYIPNIKFQGETECFNIELKEELLNLKI